MKRTLAVAAIAATFSLGFSAAASAQPAAPQVHPASIGWPVPGPKCADRAPEGAVFVKRVQPPFGIGYDVWRLPSGQLINIYC